jgi:L-threonylcarbamoyladenylate synthase
VTEIVSVERDGAAAAREALERCVAAAGIAVFPADTLYGLACDPLNQQAIERIHSAKGRGEGKPSAIMYFSPLSMRELVSSAGPRTRDALAALLPGAVTIVIANPDRRYPLASRDDPARLGVRLIEGPLAGARCAVFQTSANRSGDEAPASFDAIDPVIVEGADLAIDGGRLGGEPSTVVDDSEIESGGGWRVLREGAIAASEIDLRLARAVG